ncbi:MAG TPA: glucose-6-phosphate dehydrogenase assembly protein OpcA [Mycobacteriales bacterium]
MIVTLPDTSASQIEAALTDMRHSGGAVALGRVLTLVIDMVGDEREDAITAANEASHEHPCRVIALLRGARRGEPRVDAEIRVGGDAGASEVIVLRLSGKLAEHADAMVLPLLLPDAPVVAWWPDETPDVPVDDPVGQMAQRRITDAAAQTHPVAALEQRRRGYADGDTDLAWTRLTHWRGMLAAALDQPPHDRVTAVRVAGEAASPSTELLAAWLAEYLRCPVIRESDDGPGIVAVTLERRSGNIEMVRPDGRVATLTQPGQPERRVTLPRRGLAECLAEELRRLDADEVYRTALLKGLPRLDKASRPRSTRRTAERARQARDVIQESDERAARMTGGTG